MTDKSIGGSSDRHIIVSIFTLRSDLRNNDVHTDASKASGPKMPLTRLQRAVQRAIETRAIEFGAGVLAGTGHLFAREFPGASVLVVADENTYAAAGEVVTSSLREAGVTFAREPFIFPGTPALYSSYSNVEILREHLRGFPDAIFCSIASGTLNDLAKLASGELGRPYLNVCTAASVDGYSAFGASIERDGFKITRPCPAPAALVADTDVMAAAPRQLAAIGYGDLIEKIPAGADWILADEFGIEPIDGYVWDLVQEAAREALAHPGDIAAGSVAAIASLAEANLLSGLGMQALQSSRPASGAGHQFSHLWEMEGHGLDWDPPLSHGFKVGVGTVASCALWEETLRLDLDGIDIERIVSEAPTTDDMRRRCRTLLAPHFVAAATEQTLAKHLTGAALRARLRIVQREWPRIRERCQNQLIPPLDVMNRLRQVGAPDRPELIGIATERFQRSHLQAQLIRSRYTVLDLLADVGQLDEVVRRLFAPTGFWGALPPTGSGPSPIDGRSEAASKERDAQRH